MDINNIIDSEINLLLNKNLNIKKYLQNKNVRYSLMQPLNLLLAKYIDQMKSFGCVTI